jgi:type IV pilus assembly protein PilC
MKFSYKGRAASGEIVSGVIAADTREEAIEAIRDTNVTPFSLQEASRFIFAVDISKVLKHVSLSEKILFAKNLAGMLRAGLAISRALQVLLKQTKNGYLKSIITSLIDTIDKGGTLSAGLAKYPNVFPPLFAAMVRAGEESGGMPAALEEIVINLEKTYALKRKVKSALMYPCIIISAIIIIAILMFIYVVPTLTKTFKGLGVELPASTRLVIGLSDFISGNILLFIVIMIALIVAIVMALRFPLTRKAADRMVVHVPVLGTLVTQINTARTTRTLSSLITAGVSISRSLTITRDVLQSEPYKKVLAEALAAVEKGEPMSDVFKSHTKLYPVMVGEMMEVGEETGKVSAMLIDIATFYEAEVDAKTKDLSTIIEPVLMIFIGAGVGFFAISMLSPMYSIMDAIK